MRQAGDVIRADVLQATDGKSKGCGLVEYATEGQAKRAILSLNDTELKGRLIFVRNDREIEAQKPIGGTKGRKGPPIGAGLGSSYIQNNNPSIGTVGSRVYVGNLSYDVSWQDLKDYMRSAGDVLRADILTDPTGRSKGCGLVEYDSPVSASRAIATLNNTYLLDRQIFVREDRDEMKDGNNYVHNNNNQTIRQNTIENGHKMTMEYSNAMDNGNNMLSRPVAANRQIFVGNLSFNTTWQSLKDLFKSITTVQRVEISMDENGRSKGYATVRLANPDDIPTVIQQLNGCTLDDRVIEVRLDKHTA